MHTIDFNTALALLLRDGARRDAFRQNARSATERLNVSDDDRAAFVCLSPAELEVQADVLLRKRLERVKPLAPELCASLGENLWRHFREYARHHWHEDGRHDARHFCEHVLLHNSRTVPRAELNRLRFLTSGQRMRWCFVRDLNRNHRTRPGMQILRRDRDGRVREMWLYLALGPSISACRAAHRRP